MRTDQISGKTRPVPPRLGPDDHVPAFTAIPSDAASMTPPSTTVVHANASRHPTSTFTASPSCGALITPPLIIGVCVRAPKVGSRRKLRALLRRRPPR